MSRNDLISSAQLARSAHELLDDALVVTGDDAEAGYWASKLREGAAGAGPTFIVEQGRKGNLLGALQAYERAAPHAADARDLTQVVMLFGAGTRLSPVTQALRNIKAAFPLPDASRGAAGLTVGEGALRSSASCVQALRTAGFRGVLLKWGDEIILPSNDLSAQAGVLAGADVVRLGWRVEPDDLTASQKEWLVVDRGSGQVLRDLSRQPLDSLWAQIHAEDLSAHACFVNLGSFAGSHDFMEACVEGFGAFVTDEVTLANWDPYFWQAMQVESLEEWQAFVSAESASGRKGLAAFLAGFPDFFSCVQRAREAFRRRTGRELRVVALDYGQPYWVDAGNHLALGRALADIFSEGAGPDALRALLGLPGDLANGGSFVLDSTIPAGAQITNSVVIGSTLGAEATVAGSIVLGSRIESLASEPGASAIQSVAESLRLHGPNTLAFRLDCQQMEIGPDMVASTLRVDGQVTLVYDSNTGVLDDARYHAVQQPNPISFAEASKLIRQVSPRELEDEWWTRLAPASVG